MFIIDSNGEIAEFYDSLDITSVGAVKLDAATFEETKGFTDEVAVVHIDVYTKQSTKVQANLEKLLMIYLYVGNKESSAALLPNVIQVITSKTTKDALSNSFSIIDDIIRERQVLKSQLLSINNEVSETMGNVEVELLRVKKIYEERAPKRYEDIKGIQVYSKYTAGESVGGEFFDIFKEQGKMFILKSATSSYLASSSILQLFSEFKMNQSITKASEQKLISDIKSDVVNLNKSKNKKIEIHLFTAIIDLASYTIQGHMFGDFKVISSEPNNTFTGKGKNLLTSDVDQGVFSNELTRGERTFLCSPGFVKNWEKLSPDFMIEELMMDRKIKPLDILDEVFFQLKKDSTSGFLPYDASAIMLEVQKNVMVQM